MVIRRKKTLNVRRAQRAFTLLEILVALAIFALAAAAFVQALTAGTTVLTRERTTQNLAQNVRFALRQILLIQDEDELEEGGEFELPDGGYLDWEAEITPTDTLGLFQVDLTFAQEGENASGEAFDEETVSTIFVFRPTWGEAEDKQQLEEDLRRRFSDLRER